ncbi:Hsp70 family protein [Frankia sp. Cr1]|uniref:Hsp70 family protein n=1 Tax=Frankia sp. Cr1 TaxID=3073931 RepID=UPI002AD48462|nr:Hsp70 family protein [Frankia sp. Cr1]
MATGLTLAVDLGTGCTSACVDVDGRGVSLRLGPDGPMPAVVTLSNDGRLLTGTAAVEVAAAHPDRAQRHPLRALETTDQVQLAGMTIPTIELIAAVLRQVLHEATRRAPGPPPGQVVLTAPVRWASTEIDKLRAAAARAGLTDIVLLPEPIAAARWHADPAGIRAGTAVAVYDLGATTLATTILTATPNGFEIRGEPGGNPAFGGENIDDILLRRVAERARTVDSRGWDALWADLSPSTRQRHHQLRQQVVAAKEALSTTTVCTVAVGGSIGDIKVTRADLEASIEGDLRATVTELLRTAQNAGVRPGELTAIFLVGGSTRIPRISALLAEMTGVRPRPADDPQAAIALGALLTATTATAGPALRPEPALHATRVLPASAAGMAAGPNPSAPRDQYPPTAGYPFGEQPPSGPYPPPGAYPPPDGYPGGPPQRRPSRWRPTAMVGVIVALLALAVSIPVIAFTMTRSDKPNPNPTASRTLPAIPTGPADTSRPTSSASPSPSPSASASASASGSAAGLTVAQRRLSAVLDPAEMTDCEANPDGEDSDVDASLKCAASNGTTVIAFHYYTARSLRNDVDYRSGQINDEGTCENGRSSVGTWQVGSNSSVDAGALLCYYHSGQFVMFWSYDSDLVSFAAADTDAASLYQWWKRFDPLA